MAIMRKDEIAAMDANALSKKLEELQKEINSNKGAIRTTGKPANAKYRELKKTVAAIKTALTKKAEKA